MEEDQDYLANHLLQINVLAVSIHTYRNILPEYSSTENHFISFCININSHAQEMICCIEP